VSGPPALKRHASESWHPRLSFKVAASRDLHKRFFFEKKKQKTFAPAGSGNGVAYARRSKSFLVTFFQKSNVFL
jgi:hypothetical protein